MKDAVIGKNKLNLMLKRIEFIIFKNNFDNNCFVFIIQRANKFAEEQGKSIILTFQPMFF